MTSRIRTVVWLALLIWVLPGESEAKRKSSEVFDWDPVTDIDWAVSEDTALGMRDAVILFERILADESGNGKTVYTLYRRIRVLSDEGRSWGDVTIPKYHSKQKAKAVFARVILPDSTVLNFDPENIVEKEIVKSKGSKLKQKSFSLAGVTDNCIVEYYYDLRLPNRIFNWIIQRKNYLLHGELRWKFRVFESRTYQSLYTPNYLVLHTDRELSIKRLPSLKETKELLFRIDSVKALEDEPYTLPDIARQTQLRFYYGSAGSAEAFWTKSANGISNSLNSFCEKDGKLKKIIDSLKGLSTEEQRIETAYNWVQSSLKNTTYADGDEKFKDIDFVDDILKRGYGSRRQLNFLFCDILRELDIDARIAFVVDRDDNLLVYKAKYWQFDRDIVAIPKGNSFKFYSPGDVFMPQGEVPWYNTGISALVGGGTDETFYSITTNEPSENTISRLVSLNLASDLTLSGSASERLHGDPAYYIRYKLRESFAHRLKESLDETYSDYYPDAKIDSIKLKNETDVSKALLASHTISFETPLQQTGNRILVRPLQYLSVTSNPFESRERESTIVFSYAYMEKETASIECSSAWEIEALPSDTTFANTVGVCAVSFKRLGTQVIAQRLFTLNNPFWGPEKYAEVQSLYETREALKNLTVVLKEKTVGTITDE